MRWITRLRAKRNRSALLGMIALCTSLVPCQVSAQAAAQPPPGAARFEGESRCGNPTCHGAALPANEAQKKNWKPWKSARTQWLNRNIDHHSRAYATLETSEAKTIAGYMGIDATTSEKCLVCHAPAAEVDPKEGRHQRKDGVSCEHCHGPAELWLKPHVEKDWQDKKAQFAQRGFYDNSNFKLRAEKCASCHVEIDHEIIAGGHPPLQFEMVAYAQIVKHWDDQDKLPPGAFSVDPTLWSVGQVVGLRRALEVVARRAGSENYQALGKFTHFKQKECYQCHHKIVGDALRQAQGHYFMVDVVILVLFPEVRDQAAALWKDVVTAARTSAEQTEQKADGLARWLTPLEDRIVERGVDLNATKKLLKQITASGERYKSIERFGYERPTGSNVARIQGVNTPWWYTTGAAEQSILAIEALCGPAFGDTCGLGPGGIGNELKQLLKAVDRSDYRPEEFSRSLSAVNRKLFP